MLLALLAATQLIVVGDLVASGYEDARHGNTVIASEFTIVRRGEEKPILEFGALQTAILRDEGGVLHVTEVEQWPFGKGWQRIQVPVYEWRLAAYNPDPPTRRTLRATPSVTRDEIATFLAEYKQWLAIPRDERSHEHTEEYVARLFTAAVAGDPEAKALFLAMRNDAGLDGAAAEDYGRAVIRYEAWNAAVPAAGRAASRRP